MKYTSTRDNDVTASFEDALFSSYCADGGLYVPKTVPKIPKETLRDWSKLSYTELAKRIARLFISEAEIPTADLNDCLEKAFSSFTHPDIAPVRRLSKGLNIMELFHGKTLAFKDLALSCVGRFIDYFLERRKKRIVIVVVTSGDTGSAAIESVRDSPWADIMVFLPEMGCSEIQVLQMVTVVKENVHVFKVPSLLPADEALYWISQEKEFTEEHGLISINSTNWARIMMQTVHFFYGYFQICQEIDERVEIIVPTGACGNIAAGTFAREMGLPVSFVCSVNTNDIVHRALSTGDYSSGPFSQTIAPAMDIQYPYNIERVIYVLSGENCLLTKTLMGEFMSTEATQFPEDLLKKIHEAIRTETVHDGCIQETMKRCWEEECYAVCPHTAAGLSVFYKTEDRQEEGSNAAPPRLCIATASPAKFCEALVTSGIPQQTNEKVKNLTSKPQKCTSVPADTNVQEFIRSYIKELKQKRQEKL